MATAPDFRFGVNDIGKIRSVSGDENLRARILQVLLTTPGERVGLPQFGCGLRSLVFEPNGDVLAAAMEFTVKKSLDYWLGDQIYFESVNIESSDAEVQVEIIYSVKVEQRIQRLSVTI